MHDSPTLFRDKQQDDQFDLMGLALEVWRRRWYVAGITTCCTLVAFGLGLMSPRQYEATAKLIVTPPTRERSADGRPVFEGRSLGLATYASIVQSQALATQISKEFNLDAAPERLTPSAFILRHVTVDAQPNSEIITLRVRLRDPQRAAAVANRMAALAVEAGRDVFDRASVGALKLLGAHVADFRKQLAQAADRLENYRRGAQVDLVRQDVDTLLERRGKMPDLLVEIEAEKARLHRAEEQLAALPETRSARRAVDVPGVGVDAGLQIRDERVDPYVNPAYELLQQEVLSTRTRVAGLEKNRDQLAAAMTLDGREVARLRELYQKEAELARLEMEQQLARKLYEDIAVHYENIRGQSAGSTSQLSLLDPAIGPDLPRPRHLVRNSAAVGVLAFLLAAVVALFTAGMRSAAERERRRQASGSAELPR